ncbi:MAG: HAD hydrolase family protein [Vicinamibacterales bacterium]
MVSVPFGEALVKLTVLALDYDGTIARHDRLDPSVRAAIASARERGVTVLLVTGRILADLRRVVSDDLQFVDAVIAENGAIVHFPHSGQTNVLAPALPDALLSGLQQQGVAFAAGQCLVDAHADEAPRILEVVRRLELPLVLVFNRSRVMTLAQGVSKATGLHAVLDMLRLSARNTVAVGDAENDHEMLRLAEVAVAVDWGSPSLKAAADLVIEGQGPPAVAAFVERLAADQRLPAVARPRRRLSLGHTEDGREFSLAVRGRNVLIAGDEKSGKSWIAGKLSEQLILLGYSLCVIDPAGDYRALEALPGVTVLGGDDPLPTPYELLRAVQYPDRSVVIDLSRTPRAEAIEYGEATLAALNQLRRRTGLPHRIVIDHAHHFLIESAAHELLDLEVNGYTLVTYRSSALPMEVIAATEVMLVTCESDPAEIERLRTRCTGCERVTPEAWATVGRLAVGQAAALPITDEAGGMLRVFWTGRRLTPHVRRRVKYVDVPVQASRAFVFSADGQVRVARSLRELVAALEGHDALDPGGYVRRGDFSRWVADVFGDRGLASELRTLEQDRAADPRERVTEIVAAIRSRYDLAADEPPLARPSP